MIKKTIPLDESVGCVLIHDITGIVPGVYKGARFKKGHVIQKEDIAVLRSLGKEHIFAAEPEDSMVFENDAAARLAHLCCGTGVETAPVSEGKIELFAGQDGFFDVRCQTVYAINSIDGLALATRRPFTWVKRGDKLAGVKAIPLFIEEETMQAAESAAGSEKILAVLPQKLRYAALVVTGSEVASGLIEDTFTPVLEKKLQAFGISLVHRVVSADGAEKVAAAIEACDRALSDASLSDGAGIILCSGGMSVDPDDNTPAAIRQTADTVVKYGAPVFPGAMIMLAYRARETAVCGLPGCVMFAKTTIFDIIFPFLLAGKRLEKSDFARMGAGGLCLGCAECSYPVCSFGMTAGAGVF